MGLLTRYPCLRQVIVNCKTATVFRGVLWRRRGGYLVLRNASLLRPKAAPVPMDGEVVIERANVDFVQVLG